MQRQPDRADEREVCVSVRIAASPATVWRFLSEAEKFAAWIGAFAGGPPLEGTRVDARLGGSVRVVYPGGGAAIGAITAFEPPRRVCMTWGYEREAEGVAPGSSEVEIVLVPTEGGTRVELRHRGIPTADARRGHLAGWKHYLSMLARCAADAQHAAGLGPCLDAYFGAWREPADAARQSLLEGCCEPDVRVRSAFACTDGVQELSAHIANSLRFMPGMTLAADGPPEQLHGHVRCRWTVRAPDGRSVMSGENVAGLSAQGRIAWLVSFSDAAKT